MDWGLDHDDDSYLRSRYLPYLQDIVVVIVTLCSFEGNL